MSSRKVIRWKPRLGKHATLLLTLWAGMALADSPAPETTPGTEATQAPADACPAAAQAHRKKLLITAFPRREQNSSNLGALHDVEQALPALLGERLSQAPAVASSQLLDRSLAGSATPDPEMAQAARRLAKRHHAQLVLSGEVLDMSMAHSREGFNPGPINRARNGLVNTLHLPSAWDSRQRQFVLQLTLRDGITGEPLSRRQYQSRGAWNAGTPHRVGFDSPRFWDTDYGRELGELIDRAGEDLGEHIRCQPLTASLDIPTHPGQIILHSGTNQGLKAGDRLRLYKVIFRTVPGHYQVYRTHLVGSDALVEVQDARDSYSLAELHSKLDLHGHYVALATGPAPTAKETVGARSQ